MQYIAKEDPAYPALLREIADPPQELYMEGDLSILGRPCIALVGTRRMSSYGKRVVHDLVPSLVRTGVVTVSGLAYGIDSEVARATLAAGGHTVAILGHGLGMITPEEKLRFAQEVVAKGSLLLTEYAVDTPPAKYTFPARNRIIAGLTLGTVVLEAPEGSGALITARLALDYGREVFAIPGQIFDPNYAGCHQLIGRGEARLVTSGFEVLQELGMASPKRAGITLFLPQSSEEQKLLEALTRMPQAVDALVEKSGLDVSVVVCTLMTLELSGVAKPLGGGTWIKVS